MIEVTDEMRRIGSEMLRKCREMEVFHEQAADAVYRAMRALEPKAEPLRFGRQTAYRPEFAGEAQSAPDPRGRLFSDTVAARKAVDPEFREALEKEITSEAAEVLGNNAQIPAREISPVRILPDGSVRVETPTGAQNVGQFGFASAVYQPAEELAKSAHLWVDRTKPFSALDEIARSNRRLDAIEAFVRHLATGYNSRNDDDYLQFRRLIDALDAAR